MNSCSSIKLGEMNPVSLRLLRFVSQSGKEISPIVELTVLG